MKAEAASKRRWASRPRDLKDRKSTANKFSLIA